MLSQLAWGGGREPRSRPDPGLTNFAQAYYGANCSRLSEIKARYDPKQLFTFAQAIRPPVPAG